MEYLNEGNLIYAPPPGSSFKDRNRERDQEQELPVSQICWRICNEDPDCIAYVHLLDTDECHGYSYFERTSRYLAISGELPLVADSEAVFYEKTCLRGEYSHRRMGRTRPCPASNSYITYSSRSVQGPSVGADQNPRQHAGVPEQEDHSDAGHAA